VLPSAAELLYLDLTSHACLFAHAISCSSTASRFMHVRGGTVFRHAGFSGRMPMAELADAIVATARATLEAAIELINAHTEWGARVVYGDTDSMFVLLPGRTKESAFRIGAEIAETITGRSPSPIKLKFEKARRRHQLLLSLDKSKNRCLCQLCCVSY
jgi:hypothetical protein